MIPESEPHARALADKLTAELPANVAFGWGAAPEGVPAVVMYPDAGDVEAARLCGDRTQITMFVMLHGIGNGPEQAAWALDKARVSLLGDPPVVIGRVVHRLTQVVSSPVRRDDEVSPPLYLAVAQFRLWSQPA